jgi:hypothetical protein
MEDIEPAEIWDRTMMGMMDLICRMEWNYGDMMGGHLMT